MLLTYRKAVKKDADLLINLYNLSFYEDYIHYGECPGYGKTKEKMELSILRFTKYMIMDHNNPVGVISFNNKGEGVYHVGCLCVIPEYQGMGIGTEAFQYMLTVCNDWKRIELQTPADKEQNIQFYTKKCGFSTGNRCRMGKVELLDLYLESTS